MGKTLSSGTFLFFIAVIVSVLKFAFLAECYRDLPTTDESHIYLQHALYMRESGAGIPWNVKGFLYSQWLFLLSCFFDNYVALFYFNFQFLIVINVLLLFGVFVALDTHPLVASLLIFLQMVLPSYDLWLAPQIHLFTLLIILSSLNVALRLKTAQGWYLAVGLGVLAATYVRQEYVISLVFFTFLLLFYTLRDRVSGLVSLRGCAPALLFLALVVICYSFASPLNPKRQWRAFQRGYVASAEASGHISAEIRQKAGSSQIHFSLWRKVVRSLVGNVHSVIDAALANPPIFFTHLLHNGEQLLQRLVRTPLVYSRRRESSKIFFVIMQVLQWLLVIGAILMALRRPRVAQEERPDVRSKHLLVTTLGFSLTAVASVLLTLMHVHYLIVQNALLLILIAHFLSPRLSRPPRSKWISSISALMCGVMLYVLVVLFGPVYAFKGEVAGQDEPLLRSRQLMEYIHDLKIDQPTMLLFTGYEKVHNQASYLPVNIQQLIMRRTWPRKTRFLDWLNHQESNVIILSSKKGGKRNNWLRRDRQFKRFQKNPSRWGFEQHELKEAQWLLYLAKKRGG